MKRQARLLATTGAVLAVLAAAAFGFERWYEAGPGSTHAYAVVVTRDGREMHRFSLAELQRLHARTVKMQGQDETGPTLLSVLRAAGIDAFSAVTITGLGVRDKGELELERKQVDDRVLLDIAKRGTAKLCGPDIPYASRVRDVIRLAVR